MSIVAQEKEKNKVFSQDIFFKKEEDIDVGALAMRDNRKYGFTQIADAILTHPTLTRRAKLVYAALLHHARQKDHCWPSQKVLASECSMSVDTVQRALKDLRIFDFSEICSSCTEGHLCALHRDGLVVWKRRGLNKSNLYCLTPLYTSYDELSGKPQNTSSRIRKERQESNDREKEKKRKEEDSRTHPFMKKNELPALAVRIISDYSLEMHDVMHLVANLSQAASLYVFARENLRYTEEQFIEVLLRAKELAMKACIRDKTQDGWPARMKYFFVCARNELYGRRE